MPAKVVQSTKIDLDPILNSPRQGIGSDELNDRASISVQPAIISKTFSRLRSWQETATELLQYIFINSKRTQLQKTY